MADTRASGRDTPEVFYRGEPCRVLEVMGWAWRDARATIVVEGYEASNSVKLCDLEVRARSTSSSAGPGLSDTARLDFLQANPAEHVRAIYVKNGMPGPFWAWLHDGSVGYDTIREAIDAAMRSSPDTPTTHE